MSHSYLSFFFFNDTATTEIYTLSLHDALPISIGRLPPIDSHGVVGDLRQRVKSRALVAFQKPVEEAIYDLLIIEPCIAHAPFTDDGVVRCPRVRAVRDRRDDCPLLVGNLGPRSLADVIVKREVRSNRYVIPRHEPEAGNVERHVVMI